VRVVDLSGLTGLSLGGTSLLGEGMKEIGFYATDNADTWSAKTPEIEPDGSFFLYGNDIARGLDVYRFEAGGQESESTGTWMDPAQALRFVTAQRKANPLPAAGADRTLICMLPAGARQAG
jgi:hypothetical protein